MFWSFARDSATRLVNGQHGDEPDLSEIHSGQDKSWGI